jgi:hypothetical protein
MNNSYHDHLDICRQCREHPFNLCTEGAQILKNEVNKPLTGVERRLRGIKFNKNVKKR